jgi:hypothetical protein
MLSTLLNNVWTPDFCGLSLGFVTLGFVTLGSTSLVLYSGYRLYNSYLNIWANKEIQNLKNVQIDEVIQHVPGTNSPINTETLITPLIDADVLFIPDPKNLELLIYLQKYFMGLGQNLTLQEIQIMINNFGYDIFNSTSNLISFMHLYEILFTTTLL